MNSVVVTGCSSGIGQALALRLDRAGYRVFAGVRSETDAEALTEAASPRLEPLLLDVTHPDQVEMTIKHVASRLDGKGLDGLVNNAGVYLSGPLEFAPQDEVRRQLEVNVLGQISVTQACLPLLRRATGRIVFLGSLSGVVALPYAGPYNVSKFALEALADTLRRELRPWRLRVSVVQAGPVETAVWDKSFEYQARVRTSLPPEGTHFYDEALERARLLALQVHERAIPASRVAAAIQRALEVRHPRTHYAVGTEAKLARLGTRWLPTGLIDFALGRLYG